MKNNMKEALEYFQNLGIPVKDKYIDLSLTDEQIEALKKWKDKTQIDGIMMPEEADFYKSILLAISLEPQKNDEGQISYLFGKGIGVEIALRGNIKGREQHEIDIPYRSHSDFELYDRNVENYQKAFNELYGNQEYYPPTKTKGLQNLPEGLMDNTYETVMLDGYEVLVPQLEILFLDKFLRKENTPREEGYDCELLAEKYDLDIDLIKKYLEENYFSYTFEAEEKTCESQKQNFENKIIRILENECETNQVELGNAIENINENIGFYQRQGIKTFWSGILSSTYLPLKITDISINENGEFVLSEEYIARTIANISDFTEQKIKSTKIDTLNELDELFIRIKNQKKELDINDYAELAYNNKTIGTLEQATVALKLELTKEEKEGGKDLGDD